MSLQLCGVAVNSLGMRWGARLLTCVAGLGLWAALVSPAVAQKTPQETIESITAADGFEVKLFASEPMIVNPIAIDVDTYGRVWVTEGTKYRRNVGNPPDDKIKVLEDTDGDGVADKMTVFTSDLNAAMGVCVAGSKIYVPESPNLYVYEDKNNDLVPDGPRQVLLTGFGGKNHDHGVHSQVFGPDHKLYMTNGDTGFNVTGPDGKNIKYQWGAMIRCEADGSKLEDIAVNFRNPLELAVDSFGNVWCSDNDNDGLKSVRICWILEGGNYGWFGSPENIRNPDGSFDPIHHWRADKPGFVPYVLITGFGSPCGMTFYESDAFGPKYQNKILHCDAGPREVRCYSPERLPGVGYSATQENIVTSSDNYFRPVDPCVAPDGSIYVTDWYDGGVGGHAYNDPTRGRIYRITPKDKKLIRKEKAGPYTNDADALVALASPNHATTFLAREHLLASGEKAVPGLVMLLLGNDRNLKARALWLLDRIGGNNSVALIKEQLQSPDPAFRALAVRILRRHGDQHLVDLLNRYGDKDGEVLKEILLAIGNSKMPVAAETLVKLFDRYDGNDRYLLESLGIAARGHEAEVFSAVVEKPNAPVSPRLVNIVRVLKPQDATKYLASKLVSPDLPAESAQALIAALTAVASPEAGTSALALLAEKKSSLDVKALALAAIRKNIGGSWKSLKDDPDLVGALQQTCVNFKDLRGDALAIASEVGISEMYAYFGPLLQDNANATKAETLMALDAVARNNIELHSARVGRLLVSSPDADIRDAAIRTLVAMRDAKFLTSLLTELQFVKENPKYVETRGKLLDQMMLTNDGAVLLLRLIDTKKLDKSLADRAIAAAVEHPDVNVRLLYEKFIPVDQRPKTLGQSFTSDQILALTGDAGRGERVFLRSGAAACNKCHRVKGQGVDIGPELSQIGRKYERKALLETIMNPSAGIAPEYVPYVVETVRGKVYAGFLQDQNDERVVLKTVEGIGVQIPRSQIVELVKQEKSLMPELVLKSVTAQDAADLLAFLMTLQESNIHASNFNVLGPFPNETAAHRGQDFGPEKSAEKIDWSAKYPSGKGGKEVAWSTAAAVPGATGIPEIDVARLAAATKTSSSNVIYYFAATINSTSDQPGTLAIGSDDGIQVWLNGQKVHDHRVTRALQAGEDKVKVHLKAGKNLLLLKLDQGNGAGGMTVSLETRANASFGVP